MSCEQELLNKAYADRVVELAQKIEAGQRMDTNVRLCRKDYLVAKRYKNILNYLANDTCCPGKTRDDIIAKLQLNSKE